MFDELLIKTIFGRLLTEPNPDYTIVNLASAIANVPQGSNDQIGKVDVTGMRRRHLDNAIDVKIDGHVPLSKLLHYVHDPASITVADNALAHVETTEDFVTWLSNTIDGLNLTGDLAYEMSYRDVYGNDLSTKLTTKGDVVEVVRTTNSEISKFELDQAKLAKSLTMDLMETVYNQLFNNGYERYRVATREEVISGIHRRIRWVIIVSEPEKEY